MSLLLSDLVLPRKTRIFMFIIILWLWGFPQTLAQHKTRTAYEPADPKQSWRNVRFKDYFTRTRWPAVACQQHSDWFCQSKMNTSTERWHKICDCWQFDRGSLWRWWPLYCTAHALVSYCNCYKLVKKKVMMNVAGWWLVQGELRSKSTQLWFPVLNRCKQI